MSPLLSFAAGALSALLVLGVFFLGILVGQKMGDPTKRP